MTLAHDVEEATLDELLRQVEVLVRKGTPTPAACRTVLGEWVPDADAVDDLLYAGLIYRANSYFGSQNRQSPSEKNVLLGKFQYHSLSGEAARQDILTKTTLVGKDGFRKPLMDFSLDDCAFYVTHQTAKLVGVKRQIEAVESIAQIMRRDGVEYVTGLSQAAMNEVREITQKARLGAEA